MMLKEKEQALWEEHVSRSTIRDHFQELGARRPISRAQIKAEFKRHTYRQLPPFWRGQLDRFFELLPEEWDSLINEWRAFLHAAQIQTYLARGYPIAFLARKFTISPHVLYRWRAQLPLLRATAFADVRGVGRAVGATTSEG